MSSRVRAVLSVLYTILFEIPALVFTGISTISLFILKDTDYSSINMFLIILNVICFVLLVVFRAREVYKTQKQRDYLGTLINVTQFSSVIQVMTKPDIIMSNDAASEFYKPYNMKIVDNVSINMLTKSLESIPVMTFMMRGMESPLYIARLCKETTSSIEALIGIFKVKDGYTKYIKDNMVKIGDSFGVDITPIIRDICYNGFEGCSAVFSCIEGDKEPKYKLVLFKSEEDKENSCSVH